MSDDEMQTLLSDLVAECLATLDETGDAVDYARICADAPELEDRVRRAVALATELPSLSTSPLAGDPRIGSLLQGRYQVRERIGAGAMGVVYAAIDLELSREVAVKIVHAGIVEHESALARFEREVAALVAVEHESIVTIFDRGATDDGDPFLVMELIRGVSCAEILDAASRSGRDDGVEWLRDDFGVEVTGETSFFRQSLRWIAAISDGIEAAHRAGVVHRDIKPSNIIVRRDGRAVLLDFGIAMLERVATLTRTGAAVGTPAYMAPEALRGRPSDLDALDVYGLTATLYHLVTLRAPYVGTPTQVLAALATREPELPTRVRPGVPKQAEAVLEKGLARRPAARYASAAALRDDLHALLTLRPVTARPRSTISRVVGRVSRSRTFLGAAAATLVIAGWAGLAVWREHVAQVSFDRFVPAWRSLSANLSVVAPANRDIPVAEARAALRESLDDLVASGHQRVSALALRATFHVDQGESDAAIGDMRAVAAAVGTPYARALADRYAEMAESDAAGPRLDELPEPSDRWDAYLAGLHLIRAGKHLDSIPLLADERLDGVRHVEELRFLLETIELGRLERQGKVDELDAACETLARAIRAYESTSGFSSPTTLHVVGLAQLRQGRWEDTVATCEEALELAPWSHVTLQNLGEAHLRLGQLDRSRAAYRRADAVAPGYTPILGRWAIAEAQDGDPDEARRLLEECTFRTGARGERERANTIARVEIDIGIWHLLEAVAEREDDDEGVVVPPAATEAAQRALDQLMLLPEGKGLREKLEPVARAVLRGDDVAIVSALLDDLRDYPTSFPRLDTIVELLPTEPDPGVDAHIRTWMIALRSELARSALRPPD